LLFISIGLGAFEKEGMRGWERRGDEREREKDQKQCEVILQDAPDVRISEAGTAIPELQWNYVPRAKPST